MKKIETVIILICLALSSVGQAQIAHWKIKPTYQNIAPFSEKLFKVSSYEQMSIITADGNVIAQADSITYLTNGYALVLNQSEGKYRINQILDAEGNATTISEEYYVTDYPFFSEDKCAVANKKGKVGFINPAGKEVIPFKFAAAHPFREGIASVYATKKGFIGFGSALVGKVTGKSKTSTGPSQYIDSKGVPLKLQSEIGTPVLATSFRQGEALVQTSDDKTFFINRQGRIVRTAAETQLNLDDYFAVAGATPDRANCPFTPSYNPSYSIYTENDLKGYMYGGNVLCPAQFEEAYGFSSGFAIVKKNGKFGLLQIMPGKVDMTVSETDGKLHVEGTVPAEFNDQIANLLRIVNKSDRLSFQMEGMQSSRTLEIDVTEVAGSKVYEIEIGGLSIWQKSFGKKTEETEQAKGGIAVRAPGSVKANNKGFCNFNVSVTNRTDSSQTITINLSTGGSKSLKVGSGKTGSVSMSVKVTEKTRCTIKAKCAGGSSSYTTTLIPALIL